MSATFYVKRQVGVYAKVSNSLLSTQRLAQERVTYGMASIVVDTAFTNFTNATIYLCHF